MEAGSASRLQIHPASLTEAGPRVSGRACGRASGQSQPPPPVPPWERAPVQSRAPKGAPYSPVSPLGPSRPSSPGAHSTDQSGPEGARFLPRASGGWGDPELERPTPGYVDGGREDSNRRCNGLASSPGQPPPHLRTPGQGDGAARLPGRTQTLPPLWGQGGRSSGSPQGLSALSRLSSSNSDARPFAPAPLAAPSPPQWPGRSHAPVFGVGAPRQRRFGSGRRPQGGHPTTKPKSPPAAQQRLPTAHARAAARDDGRWARAPGG
uniref:Basic salivary proline-rich protein 1-like n=1 Tax=Phascolarctos cinereus TaxID=38626 RepID=A0A6P5KMD9_PHACI|nr:basic salivary proline-rich protein 1-like [Phascolarctos cinereus]